MAETWSILDAYGRPIRREVLTQEIAGPSLGSVRSPITGYPADRLDPRKLANILRAADQGDPLRYLELAEQIEERDMHYVGVLGTRKRSVAQLEIFVDAAGDDAQSQAHANMVRDWIARDELQDELFDILDAVGKGFSVTEIIWDTSEGQWQPKRLEWRDPRWFTFDRGDLRTPLLRTNSGDVPLEPFKFITAIIRAKSGLPIRSGLARLAVWNWMFKGFTLRDWAVFTQTYGQPVRIGKYPAGATENDKQTLFEAVKNIAGDCAAIMPQSMLMEFIQTPNLSAGSDLYLSRVNWLDQQTSKAVLGQTATTDAIAGGHAVGQEHRQVQKDIERADARAVAAILNRDLIPAWVQLEHGPQARYPRVRIGKEDEEDLQVLASGLQTLVPMGLQVSESWTRDRYGIPDPAPGERVLTAPVQSTPFSFGPGTTALNAAQSPAAATADAVADLLANSERLCAPGVNSLIDDVRDLLAACSSLSEFQTRLKALKPGASEQNLAGLIRMARVIANMQGRADILDA